MENKKQNNENESIKKSYTQPKVEELGHVSGLTKGIGGSSADSGGLSNNTAVSPPSLP